MYYLEGSSDQCDSFQSTHYPLPQYRGLANGTRMHWNVYNHSEIVFFSSFMYLVACRKTFQPHPVESPGTTAQLKWYDSNPYWCGIMHYLWILVPNVFLMGNNVLTTRCCQFRKTAWSLSNYEINQCWTVRTNRSEMEHDCRHRLQYMHLIHCNLVMPYGVKHLDQHWFR